jgi:hypothetical protein
VFTEPLSRNDPAISAHLAVVAQQRLYTLEYGIEFKTYMYLRLMLAIPSSSVIMYFTNMCRDSAVDKGLAAGWTTEVSEFETRWDQEFSHLQVVQIGSGVHSTSYPMGTGGLFSGGKASGALR